ncbi:fimbrial protein [Enterobacter asburiae]|nr:fimbrial protein [Enterobacter asburiae]
MKSRHHFYIRSVQALTLFMFSLLVQPLWADCSFTNNSSAAVLTFTLPPISVPQDIDVGTVLYSGRQTSGTVRMRCRATGPINEGYVGISDSDAVKDSPLIGVYATNIPGIGVRATWGNSGTATFANGSYITPQRLSAYQVANTPYTHVFEALLELVVIGPVKSGILDASRMEAEWIYDGLLVTKINFTSTTVNVASASCDLVEKDLTVELRGVHPTDFIFGSASEVTPDPFKIHLANCNEGVKVDFKLSASGSSGLINDYTLATIPGPNTAQGVGIQIVGPAKNLMKFNTIYNVSPAAKEGQSFIIPLTARYVQTGDITLGTVTAIATFEVTYR